MQKLNQPNRLENQSIPPRNPVGSEDNHSRRVSPKHESGFLTNALGCLLIVLLGLSACGQPVNQNDRSTQEPQPESESESELSQTDSQETELSQAESSPRRSQTTQVPEAAKSPVQKRVKVFFPVTESSDPTTVKSVWRNTSSPGVAKFALTQLLAGPTSSEKQQGLSSLTPLSGRSNCGQDFTISIDEGTAFVQFCRKITHYGIADSVRMTSAIVETLQQFSTVAEVSILDQNGNCLVADGKGTLCLEKGLNQAKLTPQSKIAINGFGSVDIGMTVKQASQAVGVNLVPMSSNPHPDCSYYQMERNPEELGVSFLVSNGRIARIDIEDSRPQTISGARVGDTEKRVQSIYKQRLRVNPAQHHGNFLTFVPQSQRDKNLRLHFRTDGTQVSQIVIGKLPEVDYEEGCLGFETD
ncbi:GerMN domain-containing protein [Coleofasciculus sp. E1-EBD-02]|uniref:GerMN domain-containing protein n=1 Tax=Coleofasciculus sp. E1-EBD-02 TaxID=3068481 RepID=UPI0032FC2D28